jgi:ribosomal protein S17E
MAYLNFKEFERNKQYWKILVTSQSKKKQNIISNDDLNTSYMLNTKYTVVW